MNELSQQLENIKKEVNKRYEYWREKDGNNHSIESECRMSECQHLLLLLNNIQPAPACDDFEEGFKKGVDWKENQILKHVVDGKVFIPYNSKRFIEVDPELLNGKKLGDHVKIIIIKDEL